MNQYYNFSKQKWLNSNVMEGVMQQSSSQREPTNKNSVEKLKNSKPPLLPKPQLTKVDSGLQKPIIKTSKVIKKVDVETNPTSTTTPIRNGEKISFKPPAISPKPQLPPKSVALNSLKSNGPRDSTLMENSGSKHIFRTPSKLPKSALRSSVNENENDTFSVKRGLLDTAVLPKNLILPKEKSASLEENEDLSWAIKEFINDSEKLSEFCKQVENCSRHSHILKGEISPPSPIGRWEKKLQNDLSLATNSQTRESKLDKEIEFHSNHCNVKNEESNCINGCKRSNSLLQENTYSDKSNECTATSIVPKSFLHRYVSTCNQTKEAEKCDESSVETTNSNVQSFLHSYKDQTAQKLNKTQSLDQQDSFSIDKGDCGKDSQTDTKIQSTIAESFQNERLSTSRKSDNSNQSGSSDINSFGKRFPWFGSFGKGSKKDAVKKGRCLSQFYSSTTVPDAPPLLREKNRTKSLPDIKQIRIVHEGLKSSESSGNPEILRFSAEYPHSDSDDDKDSLSQVEVNSTKDPKTMAYLKAKELMTSEEILVNVLKLLNVDFRNYVQLRNFENKNSCIPKSEVDKILNHLPQLQSLNEYILEDLKKRIIDWEKNPKIADVIVKKGAFLKMYTTYIQNFESQTSYLDECIVKYPKFGKIVKEFEATDRCKKLTLKHYMLKPVQRIPQYRLLLNDYLKHLNESSEDYEDTLSALKIVCDVVDHANRNVSHGDKEGRLMHFQSLLSDFELIKPGREWVKDGPLEKICRKTIRERYFILLNDCLLHTTYSRQYLKIHQELPLSGMKICYNDNEKYPMSFTVHSITKSFVLCAKSETECKEWVETLQKTITEHINRQKTFLNVKIQDDMSFKLGKEAPVWVQDSQVTMCQICTAEFTALFRRHHCRGCGKVVCRNCGSNQAPLQYRNFKPDRVCDQCFELLLKDYEDSEDIVCQNLKESLNLNNDAVQHEYLSIKAKFIKYTSASNWKKQKYIPPRLKEVSANDSKSEISGWLYRKFRKSWKLLWYVLKDHVLYVYKASEDVMALETIPVLGYKVTRDMENFEDVDKTLVFSLVHPPQTPITFRAESQTAADRWFYALTAAANLDSLTL